MSSTNDMFGWDLLYKTIETKVVRESDIIIALAHWFLIKSSQFRCVGIGEDTSAPEEDEGSELLPDGWNDIGDKYAIRYVSDKDLYILLGAKTEGTLVVNLLNVKTKNVSNIALDSKEIVKSLKGSLKTMVPNGTQLLDRYKKELVDPVYCGSTKEVTTQTRDVPSSSSTSDIRVLPPPPPHIPFGIPPDRMDPFRVDPLRDIGRGDLDPLGRGGGGMLFQPPTPFGPLAPNDPNRANFPGNRHPPGARFDPFGPPGTRPNPNNDIFRPPSEFDDMYM